ncbi:MAG: hypothetical protein ACTSR2_01000 [Candidatus Hodarchaeales archaeon]
MAFEPIRNQLKTKLESIDSIQEVHDYPTEEFGGFPAAIVKSTRNDAEFQTTTQNQRVYIFTVYILQEIESQDIRKARRIIEGVVDDVIEAFDQDQLLTGISLPSNETMIISFPVLSQIWEDPKYVVAELEVRVVVQFDTQI